LKADGGRLKHKRPEPRIASKQFDILNIAERTAEGDYFLDHQRAAD
jgi:hypothetical protein